MFRSSASVALDDLTKATLSLLEGADHAACTWYDEPGEYRWRLGRSRDDLVLTVHWIDDFWEKLVPLPEKGRARLDAIYAHPAYRPAEEELRFAITVPVGTFVGLLLAELERILNEKGIYWYKREWRDYDFPLAQYEQLKRLVGEPLSVQRRCRIYWDPLQERFQMVILWGQADQRLGPSHHYWRTAPVEVELRSASFDELATALTPYIELTARTLRLLLPDGAQPVRPVGRLPG